MKLSYCQLITLKQTHCFAALLSFLLKEMAGQTTSLSLHFPIHSLPLLIS